MGVGGGGVVDAKRVLHEGLLVLLTLFIQIARRVIIFITVALDNSEDFFFFCTEIVHW